MSKNLLMVIDCQNDFCTGPLGSRKTEYAIANAAEIIRNFNGDIIVTKDTHDNDYLNTFEGKHLPIPHCIIGTPGHELVDCIKEALKTHKNIEVIQKDTFGLYDAPFILCHEPTQYDTITIVGVCTDICVINNALTARKLFKDAEIKVIEKACAGTSVEAHNAALLIMKNCQIEVV